MNNYKFQGHRPVRQSNDNAGFGLKYLAKITTKGMFWFVNIISCVLIFLIVIGLAIWLVISHQAKQEAAFVQTATALIKEKVKFQPTDVFTGCAQPNNNNAAIVTINHSIFFGVINGKTYIPRLTDWYNDQAKKIAPNLPIEDHGENLYYLMENCR